jgi:RHS repeat-associated protein
MIAFEAQFTFNDFSLLTADHQSHSGAVVIGSTPRVQYAYADGSANHTRLTSLTYPDSRVVTLDYGTAGGGDDLLCRLAALKQGTMVLAAYSYLGVNLPVRVNYSGEPGVELTYLKQGAEPNGDAGDQYTGLDRFGRLVDQRWLKTSDGTPRERVQYGLDRASNRVWRDNLVGTSNQDEYYIYDNLYQLKTLKRGNLNDGKTDISGTPVWQEDWNYDPTGNWRGATSAYATKVNGATTMDQNRSHNQANEVLTIAATPNDWPDPTQDAAGNMTKVPQPATPTSGYDCKFDAWDRLVEVKVSGGAVVATYRYDGLKRRVTKVAGGNTRHYYYSSRWQVLEERLNALTTADRQFVWGIRHVDDLIARDRGSERFYVLHDHLSVTAIINTTGAVQERYGYDGFGPQRVMDASFGARAASLYDWETGFGAYRLDTESGFYQVRHRSYHPKLGRWISRDPLGEDFDGTVYRYVANNPANISDPTGLLVPLPIPRPIPIPIPIPIPRPTPPLPPPVPTVPRPRPPEDRDRWVCHAKCNVQQINPDCICPPTVEGVAEGPSQEAACREAKRDATQKAPRGCYARHCRCPICRRGRLC